MYVKPFKSNNINILEKNLILRLQYSLDTSNKIIKCISPEYVQIIQKTFIPKNVGLPLYIYANLIIVTYIKTNFSSFN